VTISASDMLILDTSIVVDVARNNRSGQAILQTYSLTSRADRPLISVITTGEMLGIAKSQAWTSDRTKLLQDLLSEFVKLDLPMWSKPTPISSRIAVGRTTRWDNRMTCGSQRRQE
jgi:hypothetical protein